MTTSRRAASPAVLALSVLVLAAGCATAPKESIELSATVGRDLAAVHTANRNLAVLYFDRLLAEVDRFVDEVYRPYIVEQTVDDLDLVGDFEAALAGNQQEGLDALDVLVIYTEEVTAQIDAFRGELRSPLEAQRDSVLLSIDQAFQQLQTANAVVTGHLASIVKVHEAQAQVLRDIGLDDYRQQVASDLARLSSRLDRTLEDARAADAKLADAENRVQRLKDQGITLKGLPEQIRSLTEETAGDPGDGGLQP